ncbi:ADP-ribose glycohydrolase MACROD1 isoform X5 [Saccopteryx leptura]|uniref:ADP-ribose glycohydrolase MACROD1 isoform X5 n=1 Tax=Saccopteryx leptura TaxID=249018 RepID=UPI00339CBC61
MSLQSRVSGRLAQLRAVGQLLGAPRPWPGPLAGATRTRSSACGPPASLGAYDPRTRTPAGVGVWGAAAVGQRAGVRTWAPLAMAAKVDLNTSTDWKEAKSFLKGLSDKQREEHYFCQDFIRLKKIPTWKETAKGLTVKVEEPKYKKDKHLNEKISLFRGDITKLEVDAIVNAGYMSPLDLSFLIWKPGREPSLREVVERIRRTRTNATSHWSSINDAFHLAPAPSSVSLAKLPAPPTLCFCGGRRLARLPRVSLSSLSVPTSGGLASGTPALPRRTGSAASISLL